MGFRKILSVATSRFRNKVTLDFGNQKFYITPETARHIAARLADGAADIRMNTFTESKLGTVVYTPAGQESIEIN